MHTVFPLIKNMSGFLLCFLLKLFSLEKLVLNLNLLGELATHKKVSIIIYYFFKSITWFKKFTLSGLTANVKSEIT